MLLQVLYFCHPGGSITSDTLAVKICRRFEDRHRYYAQSNTQSESDVMDPYIGQIAGSTSSILLHCVPASFLQTISQHVASMIDSPFSKSQSHTGGNIMPLLVTLARKDVGAFEPDSRDVLYEILAIMNPTRLGQLGPETRREEVYRNADDGSTALIQCAGANRIQEVMFLLEHGANVDFVYPEDEDGTDFCGLLIPRITLACDELSPTVDAKIVLLDRVFGSVFAWLK